MYSYLCLSNSALRGLARDVVTQSRRATGEQLKLLDHRSWAENLEVD